MDLSLQRITTYVKWRWNQRVRLSEDCRDPLFSLLALLTPMRAKGRRKRRVGLSRDGGYVMLDDFEGIDAALSLGVGPDVSWDYDLAEKGIPVWLYDHTITAPPREHPLFRFEARKIVLPGASGKGVTLNALLQELDGKQLVLKMDIEGDEWEVLSRLEPGLLENCRQIVVEFHHFLSIGNLAWREQARRALDFLVKDFGVVHVHGNNLSKHIVLDGHCFPDSLEVTFANRRYYQLEPTNETFPGSYDRKNNLYFQDIHLGRFQFCNKPK